MPVVEFEVDPAEQLRGVCGDAVPGDIARVEVGVAGTASVPGHCLRDLVRLRRSQQSAAGARRKEHRVSTTRDFAVEEKEGPVLQDRAAEPPAGLELLEVVLECSGKPV